MAMEIHPDEHLIWRGHPSARAYLGWYAKWGLIAVAPAVIALVVHGQGHGVGMALWKWIALSVILLAGVIGFDLVRRATIDYVVTDQRIRIRRGAISRREQSTMIDKVQNINTDQSALARILQIGTVEFDTAGTEVSDASLRFEGIARPQALVAQLEAHRARRRQESIR